MKFRRKKSWQGPGRCGLRLGVLAGLLAPLLARAGEIPRDQWIDQFSTAWPTLVCSAEDGFFRACFAVSAQRCEKVALSAVRVCMEKNIDEIPAVIASREASAKLGKTIGTCAGRNLSIALSAESTPTASCEKALKDLQQKMDQQKSSPGKDAL